MGDAQMSSGDSPVQKNHVPDRKGCRKAGSNSSRITSSLSCSTSSGTKGIIGVKDDVFVLSLDVGTTTIRAHVYDQTAARRGTASRNVSSRLKVDYLLYLFIGCDIYRHLSFLCILFSLPLNQIDNFN